MRLRTATASALLAVFLPLAARAQRPATADALGRLLREHRMEMRLEGAALTGPGADFLLREGRGAGFFLLAIFGYDALVILTGSTPAGAR